MMPARKKILIVVPCFNEASRFPVQYWCEIVNTENEIQWLFVDDGSTDGTIELLQRLSKGSKAQIVRAPKNLGKGNAVRLGLLEALKNHPGIEVIGYIDSDGAFSQSDIFRLARMALNRISTKDENTLDAIISSRVALAGRAINRKPARHYIGRVIATLLTNKWSDTPYDTQSGYKLFANTKAFKESIQDRFSTRWFFDVELLTRVGISKKTRLVIWEEPLTLWSDVDGSKLGFRDIPKVIFELIVARRQVVKLIGTINEQGKAS
jgi:glycosyltransferase involved in cell wall biosynthesis